MRRIVVGLSVVIVCISLLAAFSASASTGTSGSGGTISLGSPQVNGATVTIPIDTSAPIDPYYGWNIHVRWDPTVLSYGSITYSLGGAICPSFTDSDGGGVVLACAVTGGPALSSAGTLATLSLSDYGSGCSTVHLMTYGGSDGGDTTTGTYTLNAADFVPHSNTYGADAIVDFGGTCGALAPGSTACGYSPSVYDVDGNGVVDTPDLALVGHAWLSTPESPNWNPAADLNGDGRVNVGDAAKIFQHFGQQTAACPTNTPTATATPCPGPCPTDTPTPTATATATPTSTSTPIPCTTNCLLAGFWHVDFTNLGTIGNCSMAITQSLPASFSNNLSCTIVPLATGTGEIDLATRIVTASATFSDGSVVTATGEISLDGNTVTGTWCATNCAPNGTMTWTRIPASYSAPMTQAGGGTLSTALGDTLTVPAGALPADQTITINLEPLPIAPPPGYGSLRTAYDFGPNGLTFNSPVTMVFHYGAGDIPPGVPPEALQVYVLQDGSWSFVGGTVDTSAMTLTVQLSHFSTYGGLAPLSALVSVGGIAEQPDVTALPSAAASSGREYTPYVLGAAVALFVAAVGVAGWYVRRKRAV